MNSEPNPGADGEEPEPSLFDPTLEVTGGGQEMPVTVPVTEAPEIPDVTVTGILGKGGQGVVFRGYQDFLDRDVAVKVLHRSVDRDLARFRQEATLLARLQHPNVVACYQAGVTDENQCYMVLEYVEGQDLYQYVKARGPLAEDAALALVADVASGLQHGYEASARMIHRDVKPQNVLLQISKDGTGPSMKGKIVDLGLARCLEESMELTRAGAVMGTPSTMAPEQYDCPDEVDHRTDIYGLGCVLFFAMTGDPAFKGKTFTAIYRMKTAKKAAQPHKDLDISDGTRTLLDTMLAREQDKRPATYDELLELIRRVRADLRQAGLAEKRRSKVLPMAAAVAVLGVAGIGAMQLFGGGGDDPGGGASAESSGSGAPTSSDARAGTAATVPPTVVSSSEGGAASNTSVEEAPDDGGEAAAPVVAVPLVATALSSALPAGAELALFQGAEPFADWWRTDAGPGESADPFLWKPRASTALGDTPERMTFASGAPSSAFEDDHPLTVTRSALREKDTPQPFFVDGVSAISHALPDGEWGLRGRMALRHIGGEDHLVGGWGLRRRDGSVLELAMAVHFPEGSMAGEGAKRRGVIRAAWMTADGQPLHTSERSAEVLESPSSGKLVGNEATARLSQIFLAGSDPAHDGDIFVVDFEMRVTEDGYRLVLGENMTGLEDLAPPGDFPTNGFCELVTYGRSGFLSLRNWSLFGL